MRPYTFAPKVTLREEMRLESLLVLDAGTFRLRLANLGHRHLRSVIAEIDPTHLDIGEVDHESCIVGDVDRVRLPAIGTLDTVDLEPATSLRIVFCEGLNFTIAI